MPYTKENDVEIVDIVLRSRLGAEFSLMGIYLQFHILESINSHCLSGEIIIGDAANFIGHFPIIGQEFLDITFKTPFDSLESTTHTFYVYKTSPRIREDPGEGPQGEVYTLHFASPELVENSHLKCHKSYTGTVSSIVSTIMTDNFPSTNINTQSTKNTLRFIAPYWNPLRCIHWLSRRAIPAESAEAKTAESNYVFYQNLTTDGGIYNFVSLSSLAKQDSVATYTLSQGDSQPIGLNKDLLNVKFRAIQSYNNEKYINKFDNIQSGMLASKLFTHDITYKKFDDTTSFSYTTDFYKAGHVNDHSLMPADNDMLSLMTDSVIHYKPKQNDLYVIMDDNNNRISDPPIDNFVQEEWFLNRKSLIEQTEQQKHQIVVSGDTRINAGDVVTLNIPTAEAHTETSDIQDLNLGGRFLVTAVKHIINRKGPDHTMILEVSRDSLPEQIPNKSTFLAEE